MKRNRRRRQNPIRWIILQTWQTSRSWHLNPGVPRWVSQHKPAGKRSPHVIVVVAHVHDIPSIEGIPQHLGPHFVFWKWFRQNISNKTAAVSVLIVLVTKWGALMTFGGLLFSDPISQLFRRWVHPATLVSLSSLKQNRRGQMVWRLFPEQRPIIMIIKS